MAEVCQVRAAFKHRDAIKAIPGARWDPWEKAWEVPCTQEAAVALRYVPGIALPEPLAALLPAGDGMTDAVNAALVPVAPMPIKVRPYAHQVAAYNAALSEFQRGGHGFAFLHEQGCGKSLTAIATAGYLAQQGKVKKLLIVAPLAVLPVWAREWADYSILAYDVAVLQGTMQKRVDALNALEARGAALRIAAINYDALPRIAEALEAWDPDMIICDESQRLKNPQAKQSKIMHKLGQRAAYRIILTGTPVGNTPLDFWSQYRFMAPSIFERSFYAFRNRYAVMGGYGGYEILRYKNLDELTAKAHSVAHRVTKAQALDLPERTDQTLYCDLEPEARRIYRQLLRDKIAELDAEERVSAPRIVTQMMRLSQLTGGYLQPDDPGAPLRHVSTAKRQLLRETLADLLAAGEKVVIFARFRAEIADILAVAAELAGKDGVRSIWGDVPTSEYGKAVSDFQSMPEVRVFVAQIQTAGAGITLHAAHTAIFYSMDYSYLNYDQAKARIHRIGQHHPCTYIHLIARDTIDEAVIDALKRKRSIADDIVDNWRSIFAAGERTKK